MHDASISTYKGFSITVRCRPHAELRFKASFIVQPANPSDDSWQQFPTSDFGSWDEASGNALRVAHSSIDLLPWRGRALSHSAWMVDAANLP